MTIPPEDIEAVIREFQGSDCRELHIRFDGFELHIADKAPESVTPRKLSTGMKMTAAAPAAPVAAAPAEAALDGYAIVRAPYQSVFYRSAKPGEPPFVDIGAEVTPETEICLLEVMKLFTALRAQVEGTVVRVLAVDGQTVVEGQPLFAIQPQG